MRPRRFRRGIAGSSPSAHVRDPRASMRPRRFRRGIRLVMRRAEQTLRRASMRPRRFRRGIVETRLVTARLTQGFNEAPAISPGNPKALSGARAPASLLQ